MARLTREYQKVFAINNDASVKFGNGQFGSGKLGTKLITNNITTLQALSAFENGWKDAVLINSAGQPSLPPLEEDQALHYIETYQIAYLLQEGIPEYNADTTYYKNSIVKEAGTYNLYGSLVDNNVGNALTDIDNWEFLRNLQADIELSMGLESAPTARKLVCNGQTIAKTSGGTVNGTQYYRLYAYLWNNVSNTYAPVSTGRGVSAVADFNANKTITIPNFTDMSPMQVGTLVNSAGRNNIGASTVASSGSVSGTISGTVGTSGSTSITTSQMPAHSHTIRLSGVGPSSHAHNQDGTYAGGETSGTKNDTNSSVINNTGSGSSHSHTGGSFSGSMSATYSGNATSVVHPVFGVYYYLNY